MNRFFSRPQVMKAVIRQDGKCAECGISFDLVPPVGDHIISWADGGLTLPENCQALCAACNSEKGAKSGKVKPPTAEEIASDPFCRRWSLLGNPMRHARDVVAAQRFMSYFFGRSDLLLLPRWLWREDCQLRAVDLVPAESWDESVLFSLPQSVGFGFHAFDNIVNLHDIDGGDVFLCMALVIWQDGTESFIGKFDSGGFEILDRPAERGASHLSVCLTSYLQMTAGENSCSINTPSEPRGRNGVVGRRCGDFNAVSVVEVVWRKTAIQSEVVTDKDGNQLTFRHPVRGHFVNQWFPNLLRHKRLFRKAHLKGPEGAPIRYAPRVNVVRV